MSDIVERLRTAADTSENGGGQWYQLIHRVREAADGGWPCCTRMGIDAILALLDGEA